jgi:hypothetical protein
MIATIIVKLALLAVLGVVVVVGLIGWLNTKLTSDCDKVYQGDVNPYELVSYADKNAFYINA